MPNEKDAEIKSRYEDYSVEELRAALDAIFDSTDEFSDSDVEKMDEIMAVLDKKDPITPRYTAEESLTHFREYYREELSRLGVRNTEEVIEKEPEEIEAPADAAVVRPSTQVEKNPYVSTSVETKQNICYRKVLHTALIAAATVAVMVIVTVSAAAAGVDIWGWVPVLNGNTFRFVSEEANHSTSMDIPTALKKLGVQKPLFPTWLPEGYLLNEQQIQMGETTLLCASYLCKDQIITISIREVHDRTKAGQIEINDGKPLEYIKSGITHYVFCNYDTITCWWFVDEYLVTITGDVSIEEVERMIDSIYEVM